MGELHAVEIKAAVVDLGPLLDGHAAAVVSSIAHGDLERSHLIELVSRADGGREWPHMPKSPEGRDGVAKPAPPLLQIMGQLTRHANA